MEREKFTIFFLIIMIGVFAYMITSLIYRESFRTQKEIKLLELTNSQ